MKKWMTVGLVLLLTLGLLMAGCAQKEAEKAPKATPTQTPAGVSIPKTESGKYVITIYTGSGPGSVYFAVGSMLC
ncbi:MAG: hypothetical protein J7K36_02890 [Archaeoglobaceae archaeon]|nr:hypothetical protein [Archaeoglobaceae archaeon]